MAKLSDFARQRIVNLKKNKLKLKEIQDVLYTEDNITASVSAISRFLSRYRLSGSIKYRQRSGRPSVVSDIHRRLIHEELSKNNELSARDIQDIIRNRCGGIIPSVSAIKRARFKLGWRWSGTKYCQLIRDVNKIKRLAFCQQLVANEEQFQDVIFSDESSIEAVQATKKQFRLVGHLKTKRPRPKHPIKVSFVGRGLGVFCTT